MGDGQAGVCLDHMVTENAVPNADWGLTNDSDAVLGPSGRATRAAEQGRFLAQPTPLG